jgi:signal transduction histidine kinase
MLARLKYSSSRLRTFFNSIRFRLTLWSAGVLAIILVIFSLFVYSRQASDLQNAAQTELGFKAQQMILLYRMVGLFEQGGQTPDSADLIQREQEMLQKNDSLVVIGLDSQVFQKLGPINSTTIQQLVQSWRTTNQNDRPAAQIVSGLISINNGPKKPYMYLVTPLPVERHWVGLLILGQPIDPDGQLPRLAFTLILGSLATLALLLVGGYWLAERAMSPVRMITRTAREIGETDLNRRLHLKTQDELGELANTFDAMLDRLQAAFDRQRQFTADASHELRTPLTIVGLETEHTLDRRRTSEDYERALRIIQSENQFMSRLVNDLLTLARMDAGQTTIRLEPIDLSDVTLDVVERLTPLAQRDRIEMITGEFPEVCVPGDRQYLAQMITNLVENAIKYAGGPGKHVWVETGYDQINGNQFGWVRISDDGPGIPLESLPHLFDRFYRVDQSRTRSVDMDTGKVPDGSGLGLSIVQWIAQAHSGEVTVQSEPGKGTAFEVRLPCACTRTK